MKLKKAISTFSVLTLAAFGAFSVEWGGLVSADAKYYNDAGSNVSKFDKSTLELYGEGSLWLRVPFSKDGESYFITEGLYHFEYDKGGEDIDNDHTQYADLDLFKFVFHKPLSGDSGDSLTFSLGRFLNSDLSSLVFSQAADGALARLSLPRLSLSLYGAYTGLLNGRTVTILSAEDDDAYEEDTDKIYDLAEKFAAAGLGLTLPNIAFNQTVSLEAFGAFRLEGDSYNRLYGTLALSGPLVTNLYYGASTTFGYTKGDAEGIKDELDGKFGNLSRASVTYFGDFKDMSVGAEATFASKNFVGFTSQTAVNSQSGKQYNELLKAGLFGSIKPIENILASLSADSVFDFDRGSDSDEFGFAGVQMEASLAMQVFTDLNARLSAIQYIDKDESDNNKTTLEFKVILTF